MNGIEGILASAFELKNKPIEIEISECDWKYVTGHEINGRKVIPASSLLFLAWKTLSKLWEKAFEETPIEFEDLQFLKTVYISDKRKAKFSFRTNDEGAFEICSEDSPVLRGIYKTPSSFSFSSSSSSFSNYNNYGSEELKFDSNLSLNSDEIYEIMSVQGYEFRKKFQTLDKICCCSSRAIIAWEDWLEYLDGFLQFAHFAAGSDRTLALKFIRYFSANPANVTKDTKKKSVAINCGSEFKSRSIYVKNIVFDIVDSNYDPQRVLLQHYKWVPYFAERASPLSTQQALSVCLQIVAENVRCTTLKITQLICGHHKKFLYADFTENALNLMGQDYAAFPILEKDVFSAGSNSHQQQHLIMTTDIVRSGKGVKILLESLAKDGFVLTCERRDAKFWKLPELEPTAALVTRDKTFLLFKKQSSAASEAVFHEIHDKVSSLEISKEFGIDKRLFLRQSHRFSRVNLERLSNRVWDEHRVKVGYVDLPQEFEMAAQMGSQLKMKGLSVNTFKNGQWGSYKYVPLEDAFDNHVVSLPVEYAYATFLQPGDYSSARWIEGPPQFHEDENQILCHVYYAAVPSIENEMNFKFKKNAVITEENSNLGLEFCGRKAGTGERVMGIASRCMANKVMASKEMLWEIPCGWSFRDAATVPLAYFSAYYAAVVKGGISSRETLLVEEGSKSFGYAIICIARRYNCSIYTTTRSKHHKEFLKKSFPRIRCLFDGKLMRKLSDVRFDAIFTSSREGERISFYEDRLKDSGRLIHVTDGENSTFYCRNIFESKGNSNKTFKSVWMEALLNAGNDDPDKCQTSQLLRKELANRSVKPFPSVVLPHEKINSVFEFSKTYDRIGKIVLNFRREEWNETNASCNTQRISALPRIYVNPKKCYVIVEGLSVFGLELLGWLMGRGGRRFVLTTSSSSSEKPCHLKDFYANSRWKEREMEANVEIVQTGAWNECLEAANSMGPIGGIFIMPLQCENNDDKIRYLRDLDALTFQMTDLDYFVVIYGAGGGGGNDGNDEMEDEFLGANARNICEERQNIGLPGVAIEMKNASGKNTKKFLTSLDTILHLPHPLLTFQIISPNVIQ